AAIRAMFVTRSSGVCAPDLDPDGTIATWRWDFGDGSAVGTTRNPSHTYSAGGSYTVTLTVTDNQGAQNSVTHPVAPSQPNQPPKTARAHGCTPVTIRFREPC